MLIHKKHLTALGSVLMLFLATFTSTSGAAAASTASQELCGPGSATTFHRADFPKKPKVTNMWFPLKPGMQYTTTGTVKTATETTKRTVVHTVTGLTKVVDGVKTLVMWDRDYSDGELAESELAFFAQTRKGDVWLFGEYPEEFENGKFVGAPSTFISGLDKAKAGIAMKAKPRISGPHYIQAYAPEVDFLDCGDVIKKDQQVRVSTGNYKNVLVVDEYNPLEPASAGHQRKFYAPGTGLVKVTAVGGAEQETMDLVKIRKLSTDQLRQVNRQALMIDKHAYSVSKSVYAKTPRAEVAAPGDADDD
ncbi:hypothetical protein [Arthrobacter globiformis]|uniref:hypothetical protein n=1 Tax=Arthrobacter globiformis TaxID=1665 RepID=UPI00278F9F51|nr:hypothetical protein [Arthrobacter globiformis]MDQ0619046.1 hypothetical protein [Arthrobacter globiformis]